MWDLSSLTRDWTFVRFSCKVDSYLGSPLMEAFCSWAIVFLLIPLRLTVVERLIPFTSPLQITESAKDNISYPSALEFCFHPWSWLQVIITTPSNALSPQAAAVLHYLRPLLCRISAQWEQLDTCISTEGGNICMLRFCLEAWRKAILCLSLSYREEMVLHLLQGRFWGQNSSRGLRISL